MTSLTHAPVSAATRGMHVPAAPAGVVLGLAGLAALWVLASLLSALPQAGSAGTRLLPQALVLSPAPAGGVSRTGISVPDAGVVFAGRETVGDEPAPTF